MIVQKGVYNPFLKSKQAATQPATQQNAQPAKILNPGTGNINVVQSTPMPIAKTTRRPEPKPQEIKTIADFTFAPIEIKWSYDFDILRANDSVLEYLKEKREKEKVLAQTIESFRNFRKPNITTDEISAIKIKISSLERELAILKKISTLDYKLKTAKLLGEYKQLQMTAPRIFGQKEKLNGIRSSRKTELVEEYLSIAREYCPMTITRDIKSAALCSVCNGIIVDGGEQYICSDCDSVQKKIEYMPEGGDFENTNAKKSNYETGINFGDIVLQFQGTYPVNIPERVMEAIRGAVAQYQDFDIKRLTRTDLVTIMKGLGLGAYYKHLHRIWMDLTGNKPGDITPYVPSVNKRGELLAAIYNEIKPEDRSNFIHGIHLLWLFLRNEGYNPDMEDFVLLKSRDTELTNLDILKIGFEKLNISHEDIKWEIFQLP